jgi:D-lactate dehydrogenase (cytochrome)
MCATRASGTNAVRYGTMRENVISLRVVLPNGEIIETARRSKKSSAGYDLTRLFIGSEGTLGTIAEICLKLYGVPDGILSATCTFPDIESATNVVIQTIQMGIPIARVEILDEMAILAVNRYSKLSLTVKPTLFLEFHGSESAIKEQSETVEQISQEFGSAEFKRAMDLSERNKLWKARHDAYWASNALVPGAKCLVTDVCVPISKLTECIGETKKDMDQTKLVYTLVGHVGDGNFHLIIMMPDDLTRQIAHEANDRLVMRALNLGGTCTGEHGIGIGKKKFLVMEHGQENVNVMKQIKHAIDPNGIMNPEKIF